MKYYAVAEINITDPAWVPEYVERTTPLVERFGGKYLARTGQIEQIEAERPAPGVFLLVEWPSKEAALDFYDSEEYRPYRTARQAGSTGQFTLIAGEDTTGAARID